MFQYNNIQFPDPNDSNEHGIVASGGELSPDFLLSAYAQGIFPWFNEGEPILWWSPDPRMILLPEDFKISKSLRQEIKSKKFQVKVDRDFKAVINECSGIKRKDQEDTWITTAMIDAYINLHKLGVAHSFETYFEDKLVGGLYGISLGKAFFGESMFHKKSNASKIALCSLVDFCLNEGFMFIDVQQSTGHLRSLGAKTISRNSFLTILEVALQATTLIGKWNNLF